jgi:hypothetical protein
MTLPFQITVNDTCTYFTMSSRGSTLIYCTLNMNIHRMTLQYVYFSWVCTKCHPLLSRYETLRLFWLCAEWNWPYTDYAPNCTVFRLIIREKGHLNRGDLAGMLSILRSSDVRISRFKAHFELNIFFFQAFSSQYFPADFKLIWSELLCSG